MVTRASILRVEPRHYMSPGLPEARDSDGLCGYYVFYRILKRGKKPMRMTTNRARDEMDAYMKAREWLTQQGYKV